MDTAERTTVEPPAGSATYDGFISYSHAADDLLAPRLQAGLQRFAKPWWKRRAVRIFRDESSLAANPHLWSSITEALDDSSWFVLLLSEDAAQSEWVGKEIAHWTSNKPSDRILPVVTDGTFGWENGDVTGTSVPPALHGVFGEEPRWVDLRFARGEEQLDLQNPDFSAAVADIAATIRGVPKDELASEEVKQHRRTVRTAWAAGIALLALTVAAVVAGVFAIGQRNDARDSQALAETEATRANQEATRANQEADRAEAEADRATANAAAEAEARNEADRNARIARSRELSAAAISVLEDDPALATRLVVQASSIVGSDELPAAVVDALWRAGSADKLVDVVDLGETLYTSIALSGDGSLLAAAQSYESPAFPDVLSTGQLVVLDTETLERLWEWTPGTNEGVVFPSIARDVDLLAVSIEGAPDAELPAGRVEVFDLRTGASRATLTYPGCEWPGPASLSPDGSILVVGGAECVRPESSTGRWVELVDTSSWETIRVDDLPETGIGSYPQWSDDGRLYIFGSHEPYRFSEDLSSLQPLSGTGGFGDVSPNGALFATFNLEFAPGQAGLAIFDADTLERVDLLPWEGFPRFPAGITFTDDGGSLFVAPEGAKTNLFDLESGDIELSLPTSETDGVLRDENTGRIYTSHTDGTVKVWSSAYAAYGLEWLEDLGAESWVNGGNTFLAGTGVSSFLHFTSDFEGPYVSFFDQTTGRFVAGPIETSSHAEPTADGRFVATFEPTRLVSLDPRSGELRPLFEAESPVQFIVSQNGQEIAVGGFEGEPFSSPPEWLTTIDPNGQTLEDSELPDSWPLAFDDDTILVAPERDEVLAIDRATGTELWRERFSFFNTQVTDYGLEGLGRTRFAVVDLRTGEEVVSIPVMVDRPRGFEMSPSRDRLAIGDVEQLRILDAQTGVEVQTIPVPGVSDIHWIDEETIVIGSRDGVWARLSLDTRHLLEGARSSIQSGFTESECQTYAIDPCPTLDELKGGG